MIQGLQLDIFDVLGEARPHDDFRDSLRSGSGFANGRVRICAAAELLDLPDFAGFLREEYGTGGHSFTFTDGARGMIDYNCAGYCLLKWYRDGDGLRREPPAQHTWRQVAETIRDLILRNEYANMGEREQLEQIRQAHGGTLPVPAPRLRYE